MHTKSALERMKKAELVEMVMSLQASQRVAEFDARANNKFTSVSQEQSSAFWTAARAHGFSPSKAEDRANALAKVGLETDLNGWNERFANFEDVVAALNA